MLEDLNANGSTGTADFAFAGWPSGPGTFVYLAGKEQTGGSIIWLDGSGKAEPLHAPPGLYDSPRVSPDGKRLAFSAGNGKGSDIWVKELNRDIPTRLTFLPGANTSPVWAPDGKYLVFQSINTAAPGLFWIRSDGSGQPHRLTDGKRREVPYSISPHGKRVAFHQTGNGGSTDIFTASIDGDPSHLRLGEQKLFLGTPFNELHPAFSPDGRWLAYQSDESGQPQVYVRPFPGPGGRWQISQNGGFFPRWSRGGRELFFELAYQLFALDYSVRGDSFVAGKPESWSGAFVLGFRGRVNYDVAADGKRLALVLSQDRVAASKPPTHLTFLLNFFDELRWRAPVSK